MSVKCDTPSVNFHNRWYLLREPFWCGVLALTINTVAYGSEIFRGGIQSVTKGQIESGLSLGFNKVTLLRKIIFPIALRKVLPSNKDFVEKVLDNIEKLKNRVSKKEIINLSLQKHGLIILMDDLNLSYKIINRIGPEHLHLQSSEKEEILKKVNNAGGIFLGDYSTEAFGDYVVGTNHVLPTSGAAKFSSGLGVIDFMKKSSLVEINKKSFNELSKHVENIADVENLDAHKLSVTIRQTK